MKMKKEYLIILITVVLVYAFGFYIANNQDPLDIVYPNEDAILDSNDFLVEFANGKLAIGSSSWEEVVQVFPEGKMLGMSTIYSPANIDALLTFTEDENILCRLHITDPSIATSRNIKTGDSFSKVVETYGPNYASVSKRGNKDDFDAVYYCKENDNSIVFQIRNNVVERIVLQNDPVIK
ncbi:MAG: hypothetical protein GX790_04235 [Syntrophomonadaceae bacterium]|nr:hypothetical protein [Syntrophomonadaceae bacterium]